MRWIKSHVRLLPDVVEAAIGLVVGTVYWLVVAPMLPRALQVGMTLLPTRWLVLVFLAISMIPLQRPFRRFLVQWLSHKGWCDPLPPSRDV